MSASPSSASATVPFLGEEKNLLLIDTGAEASCCGGGRCGTGIETVDSTDDTADNTVRGAAAESADRTDGVG